MENKEVKERILVSIIIATYNAGSHIAACLLSVKALVLANIEVVIVDGGSTDQTAALVQQYGNGWVSYVSEPDKGIYDALNKGVQRARGKWLYFMGADDRLLPGFKTLMTLLRDEYTVYYANTEGYYEGADPGYIILDGKFNKYRLAKYCINHQAIVYPAKVFEWYQYELQYKVLADYALNIKVWGNPALRKEYVPLKIARYYMNGFSSVTTDAVFKADKPRLIKAHMGWLTYLRYRYKERKLKMRGEKPLN